MESALTPRSANGGFVDLQTAGEFRLTIPPGEEGRYRLAQLDDYAGLQRKSFRRRPPLHLNLEARVSAKAHPGTWGFGFWNAPFSFGSGSAGWLPALPQAAWFFHASPESYLSFRDDQPASGYLGQTFRSRRVYTTLLSPGALLLPALLLSPVRRLVRRLVASTLIRDDASQPPIADPTSWHRYKLEWRRDRAAFSVDGILFFESPVSPVPPLAAVIWIDNAAAAFRPDGSLSAAMLPNKDPAWLEIRGLDIR